MSSTVPISIHNFEYHRYLAEAVFTPVSDTIENYLKLIPRDREMLRNYYGYCPYWIDTSYYQYFQMELLTHIAYFSVDINPTTGNLGSIPNISRFYKIRDQGHQAGIVIHMTYTLFGNTNVSTFLNNASARQNAINNISNFMTNYGIEGANIDFEYVTSTVRDSFNLFMNDLAYELWNHATGRKSLYMASIAVPEWYPGYDIAYLSSHCDGLFIMAYDFHWSGSSIAGPVSPCVPSSFWGQYCAAKSIGSYIQYGADTAKILLGIPYYGYDWPTVSQNMGSSATGSASAVIYYYAFQNAITYGRIWDSNSLTPWYRYYTSSWHQCWYDDSVSLDIKFGMVNDSLLQGAGCWALGYDRSYDHIWNAIRRNFWSPGYVSESSRENIQQLLICVIARDQIKLSGLNPDLQYKISVYNELGQRCYASELNNRNSIFIGKGWQAGIYFIIIDDHARVQVIKAVLLRDSG